MSAVVRTVRGAPPGRRACVTGAGLQAGARAAGHVGRAPVIRRGGGGRRQSDGCRRALRLPSSSPLRRRAAPWRSLPRPSAECSLPGPLRPCLALVSCGEWGAAVTGVFSPDARAGKREAGGRGSGLVLHPLPRPFWRLRSAGAACSGVRGGRARGRAGAGRGQPRAGHASCRGWQAGAARHRGPVFPQDESASPRDPVMAFRAAPLVLRSPRCPGPQMPARSV